jgi:hypothetical protein
VLQQDAQWLAKWPQTRVRIDGHCDERGSAEYNLALGNRRAAAVQEYLISPGVGPDRMQTHSLGREAPFCRDSGESCLGSGRVRSHVLHAVPDAPPPRSLGEKGERIAIPPLDQSDPVIRGLVRELSDLGFPPGLSLDQALERAIVALLEVPIADEPVRLSPKGIGYAFADERLERLTGAQKQLLRMGPRNVRIIKEKLREIALALGIPSGELPSQ